MGASASADRALSRCAQSSHFVSCPCGRRSLALCGSAPFICDHRKLQAINYRCTIMAPTHHICYPAQANKYFDDPGRRRFSHSPRQQSLPPDAGRSTPLAMLGQGACAWLRAASGGGPRPVFDHPAPSGLVEVSGRRASPNPPFGRFDSPAARRTKGMSKKRAAGRLACHVSSASERQNWIMWSWPSNVTFASR